ncbi:PREDICTED: sec-independent translocase protein TatB [Prunus dulcis]|uniref:PREDICTED: sec-independent translocase protein TatB n=1 Tax=Prunus dulcis TaxID=3755 RepID=A0A5E4G991_PRUDU|nr:PREDICTED: sec-independent translocase protein TatB [Prunus dulcis]
MPTQWYQISGVVFLFLFGELLHLVSKDEESSRMVRMGSTTRGEIEITWIGVDSRKLAKWVLHGVKFRLWIEASVDSTENELVVVVVVVVGGPAESDAVKTGSLKSSAEQENLKDESGLFVVLPISAESTVADKSLIKHI